MPTPSRIFVLGLTVAVAQFSAVRPGTAEGNFFQLKNVASGGCLYFKDGGDVKDFFLGIPCLDNAKWRVRMDASPSHMVVEASSQEWYCLTVREPIEGLRKRVEARDCVRPSTWFRQVQDHGSVRFVLFREVQEVAYCLTGDATDGEIYVEHCGGEETLWMMTRLP